METSEVLAEIGRIVEEEWAANTRPVLLSNLPRALEQSFGSEYKKTFEDKTLKTFLQENAEAARMQLVQDPVHRARVGIIPQEQEYAFPPLPETSAQISAADARAFGRVLSAMTVEEKRIATLPASFVARLLAAR